MKILFLTLMLTFIACSHNKAEKAEFKLELKTLFKTITKLTYKDNACATGQVACSSRSKSGENVISLYCIEYQI